MSPFYQFPDVPASTSAPVLPPFAVSGQNLSSSSGCLSWSKAENGSVCPFRENIVWDRNKPGTGAPQFCSVPVPQVRKQKKIFIWILPSLSHTAGSRRIRLLRGCSKRCRLPPSSPGPCPHGPRDDSPQIPEGRDLSRMWRKSVI